MTINAEKCHLFLSGRKEGEVFTKVGDYTENMSEQF